MKLNRRDLLKMSGAALIGAAGARPRNAWAADPDEVYPTSPHILDPFSDELPVPLPLQPETSTAGWNINTNAHQIWPGPSNGLPQPIFYKIKLQTSTHEFTRSRVQPIDDRGNPVTPPNSSNSDPRPLPRSLIYGFNGTFPGPMVKANYYQPVFIRFVNELGYNTTGMDRGDFGVEQFYTHLHNGHTAPESDGNPNYQHWLAMQLSGGSDPHAADVTHLKHYDALYLNWPAGGDERECQSMLWFHDHTHSHTGANVYKGMVGLYPIYYRQDSGDERTGYRLPGVTDPATGQVKYDIPLALYDCAFDDGIVQHADAHNAVGARPDWWGRTFFKHYPDKGFVGDVFTVNGKAYPYMVVEKRKYRLRFLDASISRIYNLSLMRSTTSPVANIGRNALGAGQGQWLLPNGQVCMKLVQVAGEGGLLPYPIPMDSFELWPAKRREFVVDFSKYSDGSPTTAGDVVYLVNNMVMTEGIKPDGVDPNYKVPILKFIIGDAPAVPDYSLIMSRLRPVPVLPPLATLQALASNRRRFDLKKNGPSYETMWTINDAPFDAHVQAATVRKGAEEVWEFNTGGGWVHPMHLHQEEHRVIARERNGVMQFTYNERADMVKEDVLPLGELQRVWIYRKFRTFTGKYVAHCHNLAHEDHSMMFGWEIIP